VGGSVRLCGARIATGLLRQSGGSGGGALPTAPPAYTHGGRP